MNTQTVKEPENTGTCAGIHDLIDFEIVQYRKEVDGHRRDLSQAEGRCVSWQEAEKDFNSVDRATMENKWRTEYCGSVCPKRENCLLAANFLSKRNKEYLSRAG